VCTFVIVRMRKVVRCLPKVPSQGALLTTHRRRRACASFNAPPLVASGNAPPPAISSRRILSLSRDHGHDPRALLSRAMRSRASPDLTALSNRFQAHFDSSPPTKSADGQDTLWSEHALDAQV
jgi:hypothetical protein